jgi:hypothetical protein
MQYNIMMVITKEYNIFGKLLLNSIFENVNFENVDKIYVFCDNFESIYDEKLLINEKFIFCSINKNIKSNKLHDIGWQKSVGLKTYYLNKLVEKNITPVIMLDCDMIVKRDFYPLVDFRNDISVCKTDQSKFTEFLGSFICINNQSKGHEFMTFWIEEMKYIDKAAKESPALSNIINKYSNYFSIQILLESQISSLKQSNQSYIYHLKSGGYIDDFSKRLNQLHLFFFLVKYLSKEQRRIPYHINLFHIFSNLILKIIYAIKQFFIRYMNFSIKK